MKVRCMQARPGLKCGEVYEMSCASANELIRQGVVAAVEEPGKDAPAPAVDPELLIAEGVVEPEPEKPRRRNIIGMPFGEPEDDVDD